MNFDFEDERFVSITIRKVANGYLLTMHRPAKPYQTHDRFESREMVFLAIEPCLEFARKFLQNPWETQVGS